MADDGDRALRVAVLGLGEAGSAFAADLATSGADVAGYDPREDLPAAIPAAVRRTATAVAAVDRADLVLSLNSATAAEGVGAEAIPAMRPGAVFADLNTTAAQAKRRIGAIAAEYGVLFAEVALMAAVPGAGVAVPSLAVGPGAEAYARALSPHGASVELLAGPIGAASTRKLLRSIVMKGLAAAIVEALDAARRAGCEDWLRRDLGDQFGAALVGRLEHGSRLHAARRVHEMRAAAQLLDELGVPPLMTDASRRLLSGLADAGTDARGGQ